MLSVASCAAQTSKKVVADGGKEVPEVTYHTEPESVGGAQYARCEGCGNESVEDTYGETSILHSEDCLRSKVATDGGSDIDESDNRGTIDVHGCAACYGYAYGEDKFCTEECRERGEVDETPL